MSIDLSANSSSSFFDYLYDLAEKNKEKFKSAEPFPHIMFDNFLDDKSYEIVKNNHTIGMLCQADNPDYKPTGGKYLTKHRLNETQKRIFYEFSTPKFIKFLNILTGIDDLEMDLDLRDAGYTTIVRGGHLQVHKDFSHNAATKLERRLNFFIYLNDVWEDEWEGALSLWDTRGNKIKSYFPLGNRCVIFQASPIAYHGHPEKLKCPETRKSLGAYYYTKPTGRPNVTLRFLKEEFNE